VKTIVCVLFVFLLVIITGCSSNSNEEGAEVAPSYGFLELYQRYQALNERFDEWFEWVLFVANRGCGLTFLEIIENERGQLYLEVHFCVLNRPARGVVDFQIISDIGEAWEGEKDNWMIVALPINNNHIRNFPGERLYPFSNIHEMVDVPAGFENKFSVRIQTTPTETWIYIGSDLRFDIERTTMFLDDEEVSVSVPLGIGR